MTISKYKFSMALHRQLCGLNPYSLAIHRDQGTTVPGAKPPILPRPSHMQTFCGKAGEDCVGCPVSTIPSAKYPHKIPQRTQPIRGQGRGALSGLPRVSNNLADDRSVGISESEKGRRSSIGLMTKTCILPVFRVPRLFLSPHGLILRSGKPNSSVA